MSDNRIHQEAAAVPLAVIVPVYRNAETLYELADRIRATLAHSVGDYRLVFVVDASPDESWEKVHELASADRRVTGLLLEQNVGQHRALLIGLTSVRAEMYAILDADLQDPPEHLAAMVQHARCHGECVFAGRVGSYQSQARMLTSRVFKMLSGWWTGLPTNIGTYLVIPGAVARAMIKLDVRHPHVVLMAAHCAPAWSVLPCHRKTREQGQSAYSGLMRIRAAWLAIRCAWEIGKA